MPADTTLKHTEQQYVETDGQTLPLRDRVGDWIFPPKGVERAPVDLSQRRVYILPTSAGLLFAMTLALMLVGSINYNLGLGYGLTFLLTGTGLVSMLHTWRNLAHLRLRPAKTEPVFAGDQARFSILAENRGRFARRSVAIRFGENRPTYFDIDPGSETKAQIVIPTQRRGVLRPGRFRVFAT